MACYEALKSAGARIRLVLVGDGPLRESLAQRCPEAIFAGMLTHDALAAYYASADLFLFPSQTETFGNVTVEALASGLPVLAFDCAAATDWVKQGINGWLVPESQPEAYVTTALRVATTPGLLTEVAQTTRAQVSQLDWNQISEQVEEVFNKAIQTAHAPHSKLRQLLSKIKA
jgi:glycosyltransferase involved in cell wall biosynthesis